MPKSRTDVLLATAHQLRAAVENLPCVLSVVGHTGYETRGRGATALGVALRRRKGHYAVRIGVLLDAHVVVQIGLERAVKKIHDAVQQRWSEWNSETLRVAVDVVDLGSAIDFSIANAT